VEDTLVEQLRENGIEARVEWRIKRIYSIFQKIERSKVSFDQVYDLLAIRVITQDVAACYAVFGLIHTLWRPVPGRIKDFIAMPRANRYQSLHTTVMGASGHQFEVQIRTEEMHRIAEEGIAAHWKYKAGGRRGHGPRRGAAELDSPAGRVAEGDDRPQRVPLQPEDGPLSRRGLHLHAQGEGGGGSGRRHAGRLCLHHSHRGGPHLRGRQGQRPHGALRTKLRTGDIVEIVTQKDHKPSRDWLTFVKSPRARNKIKHWLNEDQRRRAVEIGRKLLEREARKFKVPLNQISDQDLGRIANEYGVATAADLLATGARASTPPTRCSTSWRPALRTTRPEPSRPETKPGSGEAAMSDAVRKLHLTGSDSLQVEGQNDLLVYRARCCNPIRGEEIVGYVTRGKGVAVHARSCPNVQNLLYESDRRIAVEWSRVGDQSAGKPQRYPVKITVFCDDRTGMLKELTAVISDDNTNIRGVDMRQDENGEAIIEFVVEAEDLRHLNRMVLGLRRVGGVRAVQRTQKLTDHCPGAVE
jgi:guanosine-3',5'-bis(diphosphate) 3'-pyrophosphohydrolase